MLRPEGQKEEKNLILRDKIELPNQTWDPDFLLNTRWVPLQFKLMLAGLFCYLQPKTFLKQYYSAPAEPCHLEMWTECRQGFWFFQSGQKSGFVYEISQLSNVGNKYKLVGQNKQEHDCGWMWLMTFLFVTSSLGRQNHKRFLRPQCSKDTVMKSPRPERATWTKTVDDRAAAWLQG